MLRKKTISYMMKKIKKGCESSMGSLLVKMLKTLVVWVAKNEMGTSSTIWAFQPKIPSCLKNSDNVKDR